MTSYKSTVVFLTFLLFGPSNAFQLSSRSGLVSSPPRTFSTLKMSELSEVEKLRAAAAKAREEYERLSKEAGKEVISSTAAATTTTPAKTLSTSELRTLASSIDFASGDASTQTRALDSLVDSGDFTLWKSAVRRTNSVATSSNMMSLLKPYPVTLQTLDNRTGGKVTGASLGIGGEGDVKFEDFRDLTVVVVLGSTALGIGALAVLPPNVGATFSYLFALIPVGFIGVGSVAPGLIAGVIQGARGESDDESTRKERICRHEAGHFLCGYLCGLPVKSYEINPDTGAACVEFHTDGGDASGKQLSEDDIAALSVVAMSGSVAEILSYGKATGGENDLLELQNCFRRSKEFIGSAKQQDLTRWGALTSFSLLKGNMDKYEKLVVAFKEQKSLADCVAIIESSS
ncbi:hypothetical protein HJC23_002256 [Cyclotella cryptica]|uniref:Peptidase M41 domain-containing protein n=1 Tax=Cyclotella cryptica TaxID=29204 RepID=A0ABD3QFH3_9STRA|eukprot:CCRYP_005689-RA/>CCRYP_005689-RA protein AED:0.00 eAED:0.00 QI:227/1/1/1/0.5/0.33/3/1002/401